MQIAVAVEKNSHTLSEYGRYCSEMHKGISDNRTMIIADREAASVTRTTLAKLDEEVKHNGHCMETNNDEIYERFEAIEKARNEETIQLEQFTKSLTD
jgi:hypothetical protein